MLIPSSQTFPALFGLYVGGLLPQGIHVIGYARTKMDDQVSPSLRTCPFSDAIYCLRSCLRSCHELQLQLSS